MSLARTAWQRRISFTAHQILVAMKREIPEPRPYPFCRSSSKHITMIPAKNSWRMIRIAFPTPSWPTLPYIPDRTYATASPRAIRIPSSFCAPFLRSRKRESPLLCLCMYTHMYRSVEVRLKNLHLHEGTILTHIVVHLNDVWANQELHHKSSSDNWGDPQLHGSSTARGKNEAHPVLWISACGRVYSIQW